MSVDDTDEESAGEDNEVAQAEEDDATDGAPLDDDADAIEGEPATVQQRQQPAARQADGRNAASSGVAPLLMKLVYGFFDEHDKWQQSGPLTWQEAGHQIAASVYLGRHPFVWDPGLRVWRPLIVEPEHAADVVHGALANAGWSTEQRTALLSGPDGLRAHSQAGRGHTEDMVTLGRTRRR